MFWNILYIKKYKKACKSMRKNARSILLCFLVHLWYKFHFLATKSCSLIHSKADISPLLLHPFIHVPCLFTWFLEAEEATALLLPQIQFLCKVDSNKSEYDSYFHIAVALVFSNTITKNSSTF